MPLLNLNIGDTLIMKKKHPCGSFEWETIRLGADIGISCRGCGRKVLMPRAKLETRVKKLVPNTHQTTI
jgi:hypothetical protein